MAMPMMLPGVVENNNKQPMMQDASAGPPFYLLDCHEIVLLSQNRNHVAIFSVGGSAHTDIQKAHVQQQPPLN